MLFFFRRSPARTHCNYYHDGRRGQSRWSPAAAAAAESLRSEIDVKTYSHFSSAKVVREPSERRKNTANERRIAKQYKEGTPVKYNQGGATSRGRRVDGTLETLLSRRRRKTSEEARKCVAEIHATARSFKKRCEISSNRRDISPRLALFHKEAGYFTKRRHVSRTGKGIAISKRHV